VISRQVVILAGIRCLADPTQATNVLVNDVGNINICDFGLSQLKLDLKRKSKEDPVGKGTMRWLSPERMKGGPLTWKCDVYSFGMVMYEVRPYCQALLTP
jgi:serine/threonine protein kinase